MTTIETSREMTDQEAEKAIRIVVRALKINRFGGDALRAREALVAAGREAELVAAIAAKR
jgi:hypothetical protein